MIYYCIRIQTMYRWPDDIDSEPHRYGNWSSYAEKLFADSNIEFVSKKFHIRTICE